MFRLGRHLQKVTPTGLEQTAKTPGNTAIAEKSGAESGAVSRGGAPADPDRNTVIDAWPTLSDHAKRAVLEIVNAGSGVA